MSPAPSPSLFVAYGSETGTAHEAALAIYNFARSHGLGASGKRRFGCLDDAGLEAIATALNPLPGTPGALLVVACATSGQGDPPANALKFWRRLMRRDLGPGCLGNGRLQFALVGFGDSSYVQYNYAAKKMNRRLESLGATAVCPMGLANDQDELGSEQGFRVFADHLSGLLISLYGVTCTCVGSCLDAPLEPLFKVTLAAAQDDDVAKTAESGDSVQRPRIPQGFRLARVLGNRRLTRADHFQDTRLISLALAPETLASESPSSVRPCISWPTFQPGDSLQVLPSNNPSIVLGALGSISPRLDPSAPLSVSQLDPNFPPPPDAPPGASLSWLFANYFDLTCVPRRRFFECLRRVARRALDGSRDCGDRKRLEMEVERLGEFVRSAEELATYCQRPRRNAAEALRDFPAAASCLDYADLFELLWPMQPRSFSIASWHGADPARLDILVAVVKYRSRLIAEPRLGLCSNYLADRCPPGSLIPVRVQRGTFRMPPKEVPLILVGPGTGIAPFRGIAQQRYGVVTKDNDKPGNSDNDKPGNSDNDKSGTSGNFSDHLPSECAETLVFFGCRHPDKDFYFDAEWRRWSSRGLRLFPAHSRPDDPAQKRYVQDRILEQGPDVARLLLELGGVVMVAGNAKSMPKEVLAVFAQVLMRHAGLAQPEADAMLECWQKTGRYQMETWS